MSGRQPGAGRPRRLGPRRVEVKLTQRQGDALQEMWLATGRSIAGLLREAVETYLVANGYMEPKPTNERNAA